MTYGTEQPPIIGRQAERRQLAAAVDACRGACGGALLLNPRTVDYHLRRIFERLGVTSRAALIRRCAADSGSGT